MTFIKKKPEVITEEAANPFEQSFETSSDITAKAQQALMKLVEGEADAINQYEQAIEMVEASEAWLSEAVMPTLKDIRREEKKHLGQLYSKIRELPGGEEDFADGEEEAKTGEEKESVQESVQGGKVYDGEKVYDIISDLTIDIDSGTQAWEEFGDLARSIDINTDYTAEELDAILSSYEIDSQTLMRIETLISELPDAREERIANFRSVISEEIETLKNILDGDNSVYAVHTYAARDRIMKMIDDLEKLSYDGSRNVVYDMRDWREGSGQTVLM